MSLNSVSWKKSHELAEYVDHVREGITNQDSECIPCPYIPCCEWLQNLFLGPALTAYQLAKGVYRAAELTTRIAETTFSVLSSSATCCCSKDLRGDMVMDLRKTKSSVGRCAAFVPQMLYQVSGVALAVLHPRYGFGLQKFALDMDATADKADADLQERIKRDNEDGPDLEASDS